MKFVFSSFDFYLSQVNFNKDLRLNMMKILIACYIKYCWNGGHFFIIEIINKIKKYSGTMARVAM